MINSLKDLAIAYRTQHTWPGGYTLHLLLEDGATLCHACFKENYALIADDLKTGHNSGWKPYAQDCNWEDPDLYCDHCGNQIVPEYGQD